MKPGELIQERYELENRLGRGGMGQVWRARDVRLERTVALKLISPGLAEQPEFLVRFLREAQSIARINHPNVVNILDFGEMEGAPFLVMEYVPGNSLAEETGKPMDEDRAREIIAQAASGAAAAHAQEIVHRDIKPANILVTEDGRAKLVDFGIAAGAGAERLTVTGTTIGSPHYISPEQASGDRATPASDVYSLGIVLYELLAGRRPFEAESVAAIAAAHVEQPPPPLPSEVDEGLGSIVSKSLSKEPSQRFADGAELAEALRMDAPHGTAVMVAPVAAASSDTAVLEATGWEDDGPPPSGDSIGKAILMGVLIGLVLLAILVGVMLLVRSDDDAGGTQVPNGGGGSPGPAETTEEAPAEEPADVPGEEAPAEDPPADEEAPAEEDDAEAPGPGLVPDDPPGEGEEDDTGEDPVEEEPADEATSETEVDGGNEGPGGGGGGGGED